MLCFRTNIITGTFRQLLDKAEKCCEMNHCLSFMWYPADCCGLATEMVVQV
jgi:hypothetical protein